MKKTLTTEQAEFLHNLTLQYGDMLTKYAYRFFGYQPHKLQAAQDAVQETFIKAVQDVETLMAHPNQAAWLKVSLRYCLFNMQRNPALQMEELQADVKDAGVKQLHVVLDAFDRLEQYPRLKEVVNVAQAILTEDEFIAFHAHYLTGLTIEEAAIATGETHDTIRGRISRLRKKLRRHFGFFAIPLFFVPLYTFSVP